MVEYVDLEAGGDPDNTSWCVLQVLSGQSPGKAMKRSARDLACAGPDWVGRRGVAYCLASFFQD